MRRAVKKAYADLFGTNERFIFSGWGGQLTEGQAEFVRGHLPEARDEEVGS
jgi:hypothetical protein